MQQYISRRHAVGEKQIVVLDGLFPAQDVKSLHRFLEQLPYRINEIDSPEQAHNRNWVANLPVEMASGMPILGRCVQLSREFAAEFVNPEPLQLRRVYVNLNRYGDMQYPHLDAPDGVTALYYANSEWHEDWSGETVFYDNNRDPVYLVAPRPGRLVLFHPGILHRGGVPSRVCWEPRLAVAFKLQP